MGEIFDANLLNYAQLFKIMTAPLGSYAPRLRLLSIDYKRGDGKNCSQDIATGQHPDTTDEQLVELVRSAYAESNLDVSATLPLTIWTRCCRRNWAGKQRKAEQKKERIYEYVTEGEDVASVYTHNRPLRRRLERLAQERPDDCKLFKVSHGDQAVEYYIPKSWVKITPTRRLSEEQKAAKAAIARRAFLGRNTTSDNGVEDSHASGEGSYTP